MCSPPLARSLRLTKIFSVKIFLSWQSDVAQNATTRAIRGAIAKAAAAATARIGAPVTPEEATRDVSGAPYIPAKLAEKIRGSDIFVADITTVAKMPSGKSVPNPNVTFELGIAAAHLGWDRVVLLFNRDVAEFKDLPFDFDRHRISTYSIVEAKAIASSERKALEQLVTVAIDTILDQNPPRPRDLEGKTQQEIKHERDTANLRWFFRHMSVDMLGTHCSEMPDMLHYFAPMMYDGLNAVVTSPSFRLYDKALDKRLRSLVVKLGKSLGYYEHYRELNNAWVQGFGQPGPHRDFQKEREVAKEIRKIVAGLARELEHVVETVRSDFIEIDLDETSRAFALEYRAMVERVEADY